MRNWRVRKRRSIMVLILSIFATGLGLGLRNRWCQLGVAVNFPRHFSIIMYFICFSKVIFWDFSDVASLAIFYHILQAIGRELAYSLGTAQAALNLAGYHIHSNRHLILIWCDRILSIHRLHVVFWPSRCSVASPSENKTALSPSVCLNRGL